MVSTIIDKPQDDHNPNSSTICNLCLYYLGKDVKFLIQPKLMTTIPMMMPPTTVSNEKLNFLFLIHSSEDNAARRSVIRSTWASLRQVHEHKVQFIFCIRHQEDSSAILQKRRKKRLRSPKILPEWVKNSQETFSDVRIQRITLHAHY